jgi:diguanylate cyclase (GGDEF)-like protein
MLGNKGQREHATQLEQELASARKRIAELERDLEVRSVRDPLTDLLAFGAFERRLDEEVERSRRHGRALAVAMVDVDGFRGLNARNGRHAGDDVLRKVAHILENFTRATDVTTRASADEFIVMLPETNAEDAKICLERILIELEGASVGSVETISASIGITEYTSTMSSEEVVASAGTVLDRARAAGGARIEICGAGAEATGSAESAHQDAIAGLAEALLERDRYTGEHSESVVDMAAGVARGLGLDTGEIDKIRQAALLHDIGKVAIPDEVLHKDGPLNDEEWEVMRQHPAIGERILRSIPGLGGVARIVRHEHERFDGGGYPDGLSGNEIPIGSRIILACDAYHAMTSDRPYRKAMEHSAAVRELAASAGTQFDPEVTEQLIGSLYGQAQSGRLPGKVPVAV